MRRLLPALALLPAVLGAQPVTKDPAPTTAATTAAITAEDLRRRLLDFADDSMLGRAAGTTGNVRATAYLERELRRLGLVPAGDGGTFFQNVPLVRRGARDAAAVVADRTPARNVVAILPGSDPAVAGQYVALGAHNDHVGVVRAAVDHDSLRAVLTVSRPMGADSPERPLTRAERRRVRALADSLRRAHGGARRDSVYNGADDDGSGSMALLEIAESLAAAPVRPRRSILFVWHTGEELGLYGSIWYTDHPTVPRDSIVAQLNVDMIGRGGRDDVPGGGPAYLQLIGSRRLSTELGDLVERVERDTRAGFAFDYQFDANGHPEQYYCRSDHYEYARWGIPVTFFSTGGHRDYHQLTDEPQYIDYPKYARVTTFVRDVATRVADLDHRLRVDGKKPDPHGGCVQ